MQTAKEKDDTLIFVGVLGYFDHIPKNPMEINLNLCISPHVRLYGNERTERVPIQPSNVTVRMNDQRYDVEISFTNC